MDNRLILPLEQEEEVADAFAIGQFAHAPQLLVEETAIRGSGVDVDGDGLDTHGGDGSAESVWWRKPSPWWLLAMLPLTAISMSATLAPRIDIYTILACRVLRPEYSATADLGYMPSALYRVGVPSLNHLSTLTRNETGPDRCATDPVVQAAVAKLTIAMSTSMGILSCITTGWWGSFSDRQGRTAVLGISVLGLLLTDLNFIIVYWFAPRLPGNYWFLVAGPILEGVLGGMTSTIAAIHAYIADCTDSRSRSRYLSLSLGLLFAGVALGPTLAGLIIRASHQVMFVFYAATAMHLIYAMVIWTVCPESLSKKQMAANKRKYDTQVGEDTGRRRVFGFLRPLAIFLPVKAENGFGKQVQSWNLTLLALAYASTIMLMGSYSMKFQYASLTFGWDAETLGYWLSLLASTRAVHLTVVLPVLIRLFRPNPRPKPVIRLVVEPSDSDPLLSTAPLGYGNSGSPPARPPPPKAAHDPTFDLAISRYSLLIDMVAYILMGLAVTPVAFTAFSVLSAMGSGFSPTLQSVALELYVRRERQLRGEDGSVVESGKLFGALSVVQALSSQIVGPAVFGFTYVKTVATFPRAIFFLSATGVMISFVFLSFVHLPNARADSEDEEHSG